MTNEAIPSSHSLLSRFQRWTLISAVLFLFLSMFFARVVLPPDQQYFREFGENDFLEYWTAYQLAERGMDPFNPKLVLGVEQQLGWAEQRPLMMWNPPWTLTLLSPILHLSFDEAARAFLGLNYGLGLCAVLIAAIALGFDGIPLLLVSALALCNFPFYLLLMKGQISLIPMLGISLLFLGLLRNRPVLAGLAMIPFSVKPHLAYLCILPLCFEIIYRRWKSFVVTAGFSLLILLFLTWILFPESLGFWWERSQHDASPLLVKVTSWKTTTLSFAIRNAIFSYTEKLPIWPMWGVPIFTTVVLTLLCLLRPSYLRSKSADSYFGWKYFLPLLLPLSITTAPFGWIFDCVSLMISTLAVFAVLREPGVSKRVQALLVFSVLFLQFGTVAFGLLSDPTLEAYWPCPLLFAALSYCVWAISTKTSEELIQAPPMEKVDVRSLPFLPLLSILGVGGVLRFLFVLRAPPFFDENGNIFLGLSPAARDFLSPLKQARPFLNYQFTLAGMLPGDPILYGRIMTGCTSFLSIVLLFLILRRFSGTLAGIVAAVFWAVNPFHVFHERMVLQDPFLTMCLLCSLSVLLLAADFPGFLVRGLSETWKRWALAGMFFGLAVATKITAVEQFPFLTAMVFLFASRNGQKGLFCRNLFHSLVFFLIVGVFTLYAIAGTFQDYGLYQMTMGHLPVPEAARFSFMTKLKFHLEDQFTLFSSYLGKPFTIFYLGLLCCGLFLRSTRPLVLMIALLTLTNTQLYQGRWYTRYFHPDFIFHALFLGMFVQELARWRVLEKLLSVESRRLAFTLSALALGLLCFSRELYPIVFNPTEVPEPKQDSYLSGYYSGKGVLELRAKLDEILGQENRVVIFSCQYLGTGMYEALLHSLTVPNDKLSVVPFELLHPNRILGVLKLMKKFQEERPGKTTYLFLFESPRYPPPPFLNNMGVPITESFNLLRETTESHEEYRFWLERLGEVDEEEVLRTLASQRAPYADDWLGPKAEIALSGPPEDDLLLSFPKDLPATTRIEIALGQKSVFSGYASDIRGPLLLPKADFANPNPNIPIVLSLRCSEWIIPGLSSGQLDGPALCARLSGKLRLVPTEKSGQSSLEY